VELLEQMTLPNVMDARRLLREQERLPLLKPYQHKLLSRASAEEVLQKKKKSSAGARVELQLIFFLFFLGAHALD
jgi:hypothetical protein